MRCTTVGMEVPTIMKKMIFSFAVATLAMGTCALSFAQYIAVVNNDLPAGNTATIFKAAAGLPFQQTLTTPGHGLGGGDMAAPRVVINKTASCIFVANSGDGSISAFKGPTLPYTLTGNFTAASLDGSYSGIGLALSPNGTALYAAYSRSKNLAVWKVSPTSCSLFFVGMYPEFDHVVSLAVSSDGMSLVVSEPLNQVVDGFAITGGGFTLSLTSQIPMATAPQCAASLGCYPMGIDIARVTANTAVVIGNGVDFPPYYVAMTLTAPGVLSTTFTNNPVCTTCTLTYTESPEFDHAAYASGNGYVYFSASGSPGGGHTGVASCPVAGYVISCTPSGNALQYTCTACNAGNISLVKGPTAPNGLWQTVFQGGTGYVDLPKVVAGIPLPLWHHTPYIATATPAYSVAAYPGRPLN
jgi:WD40 repeat protein